MSITVKCPKCEASYKVPWEHIEKKAQCRKCKEIFKIQNTHANILEFTDEWEEEISIGTQSKDSESFQEPIKTSNQQEKLKTLELKPNRKSFMFFHLFSIFSILPLILLIVFVVSSASGWFNFAIIVPVLFLYSIFIWIVYILSNIRYKKESYQITHSKIIYNSGSLFSDNSVEVSLNKACIVELTLPFVQHKLFQTGNLSVKTAWSASAEIKFTHIEESENVYKHIGKAMQHNGFHLEKNELVQAWKPHILWVIGEVWKTLVWSGFVLLYIFIWVLEDVELGTFLLPLLAIYAVIILTFSFLKYMDLKKREYNIFKDTIEYKEWFLTKHTAFIPMENVSDTENKQSILSRIFWLHDLEVSCQWDNNKVIFKNMTHGEKMMKNIKYLKNNIIKKEVKNTQTWVSSSLDSKVWYIDKTEEALDYDKEFVASYKMNIARTIAGTITSWTFSIAIALWLFPEAFLIVVPFIVIRVIWQLISINFTHFNVENSSIEKTFNFLSNQQTSFSIEKITSVVVKQNLIDMIFGTCSVYFFSIGSGQPIVFENIKYAEDLEKNLTHKIGIGFSGEEELIHNFEAHFTILNFFKANVLDAIVVLLFIFAWIFIYVWNGIFPVANIWEIYLTWTLAFWVFIVVECIRIIYWKIYYAPNRYIKEMRENYIYGKSGLIFIEKKYSLLRHIKSTKTIKYPATNTGNIRLDIAGEQKNDVEEQKKSNKLGLVGILINSSSRWAWITTSNSFSAKYIKNIFAVHDQVDTTLNLWALDQKVLAGSKQDIGNSIIWLVILAVFWLMLSAFNTILLALVSLLIVSVLGLVIWNIKVKIYLFESSRINFKYWIVYKKRHSILYRQFNFIDKNQWFINKIFKNGNVGIYTLWSSAKELSIKDIDNYKEVYETIKTD